MGREYIPQRQGIFDPGYDFEKRRHSGKYNIGFNDTGRVLYQCRINWDKRIANHNLNNGYYK